MKLTLIVGLIGVIVFGCSNDIKESTKEIPSEINKGIYVYFSPRDNCESVFLDLINSSRRYIHCAFFDVNLKSIIKAISKKSKSIDVKVVIDDENCCKIKGQGVRQDTRKQYSHNKFCIIDGEIVITGSMNPTYDGLFKNNNNLLVIYSRYLARNYEDEFMELWNGLFGSGEKVRYPIIYLNGYKVENYFCPEDKCSEHIIREISNANRSIYFMVFSFTNEEIADAILFNEIVDVKGIFEKKNAFNRYSQYKRMKGFGYDLRLSNSRGIMHHKVFIIDNKTIITGSMNPTKSGDTKNDENILIIHNEKIAKKYVKEFIELFK